MTCEAQFSVLLDEVTKTYRMIKSNPHINIKKHRSDEVNFKLKHVLFILCTNRIEIFMTPITCGSTGFRRDLFSL